MSGYPEAKAQLETVAEQRRRSLGVMNRDAANNGDNEDAEAVASTPVKYTGARKLSRWPTQLASRASMRTSISGPAGAAAAGANRRRASVDHTDAVARRPTLGQLDLALQIAKLSEQTRVLASKGDGGGRLSARLMTRGGRRCESARGAPPPRDGSSQARLGRRPSIGSSDHHAARLGRRPSISSDHAENAHAEQARSVRMMSEE